MLDSSDILEKVSDLYIMMLGHDVNTRRLTIKRDGETMFYKDPETLINDLIDEMIETEKKRYYV